MIHAASGKKSATSSGSAWGASPTSRSGGDAQLRAERRRSLAEDERLRNERERRGARDEGDRQRSRPLVDPARRAGAAAGLLGKRAARDEARHAGQRVEREHEAVAPEDVHDEDGVGIAAAREERRRAGIGDR
jgi:hypothetical protein